MRPKDGIGGHRLGGPRARRGRRDLWLWLSGFIAFADIEKGQSSGGAVTVAPIGSLPVRPVVASRLLGSIGAGRLVWLTRT